MKGTNVQIKTRNTIRVYIVMQTFENEHFINYYSNYKYFFFQKQYWIHQPQPRSKPNIIP